MHVLNDVAGVIVLNGMITTGMTSLLTNIDAKRSNFFHRFKVFENEVVRMCILLLLF